MQYFACTRCNGKNSDQCRECKGTGMRHHRVTQCPYRELTDETVWVMKLVDFAGQGQLPLPGGVLSQTMNFLDAMAFVQSERRLIESSRRRDEQQE